MALPTNRGDHEKTRFSARSPNLAFNLWKSRADMLTEAKCRQAKQRAAQAVSITPAPSSAGTGFWEERAIFIASPIPRREALHDRHSAAERDRRPAPGARPEQHDAGHADPLASGCRATTPCGCREPIMPASPRRPWSSGGCCRKKNTRHDLGREKLVTRIWDWKNEYERRILGQLKRMGC